MLQNRKQTVAVMVGNVQVGGGAQIAVQFMTNTSTQDVFATTILVKQISLGELFN